MHAALLAQIDGGPRHLPWESTFGDYPAVDVDSAVYLDERRIFFGEATDRIEVESEQVYVNENEIVTDQEKQRETAHGEWFVDFDAGWIGVSNSDMEWFNDYVAVTHGVEVREGFIDLDSFAEYLSDHRTATAWQVGRKQSLDDDDDSESVQIDYHDSARMEDARRGDNVQLGFHYRWDGTYVKGTITRSGYVAMHTDLADSVFARWMAKEVVPFLTVEEAVAKQSELDVGDVENDGEEESDQEDADQQTLEATEG